MHSHAMVPEVAPPCIYSDYISRSSADVKTTCCRAVWGWFAGDCMLVGWLFWRTDAPSTRPTQDLSAIYVSSSIGNYSGIWISHSPFSQTLILWKALHVTKHRNWGSISWDMKIWVHMSMMLISFGAITWKCGWKTSSLEIRNLLYVLKPHGAYRVASALPAPWPFLHVACVRC